MQEARRLTAEQDRKAIGEQLIGSMLSGSPPGDDGHWPHEAVREVIEQASSSELERGFQVARYNSRGVVSRSFEAGGKQEYSLAKHYQELAEAFSSRWPRTAALMNPIAETYQNEGETEDREHDFREEHGM